MEMTLWKKTCAGIAAAACVACSACGGMSYGNGASPDPLAPSPAPPANVVTIDVAEVNGPYSFFPSPAAILPAQTVVWRNTDTVPHHVVFENGSVDTGTLAPGTVSQPFMIPPGNWSYHCAIHPEMVGRVEVSTGVSSLDR